MGQVVLSIVSFFATILAIQGMPSTLDEGFITMNREQTATVQAFALQSAIDKGDSEMIKSIIKKIDLMRDDAIGYLAYGGLNSEYAELAYDAFLPALEAAGLDQETSYLALQTIANLVCRDNYEGECDVADALSKVAESPHYGCNENCFCLNQKDIFLWTRFTSKNKQATQALENNFYCRGLNGETLQECSCNGVEELDVEGKKDPVVRQSDSSEAMMQLMLQQMAAGGADPAMLSIMANMGSGASSEEAMKQMMMASMGLDPSMTHLMLNGGEFHEDPDKNKELMLKFMAKKTGMPAEMIPLLTGDPDGKDFLIYNMILAGDIDPMTGFTMLSSGDTVDKDALNDLLTNGMMGGENLNAILANAVKPYMPQLPEGIYPGSSLYFAHFEALQVSTCALHDLRNRFECGYIGISAYDCEIAPYCCYAPVFMTDEQVTSSTDGAITAASTIPWCYYNVFFVFPTEFSLTVQNIGGFPAPYLCLPYFKFGLELDDTFSAIAGDNPSITNPREDCGFPGITEFHCVAIRGCCFDSKAPALTPQCHKATEGAPSILNAPIPDMFIGVEGQCDPNPFKIPFLYYHRVPCHYSLAQYQHGFDILQEPTKEDCLTRLHCCYESDDEVIAAYPETPRCFHKLAGGKTSPLPIDAATLTQRMGETNQ